jgi:branched-chain amino acid transport system substrate-binding protein
MRRRTGAIAGLVMAIAATVAIVATTATAKTNRSAAPAAAGSALVKCGKTRTIGLLAPITGPAASLGVLQVNWFRYYIKTYNATHKTKFKEVDGDTMLGTSVSEAVKAAQAVQSNSSVLGVVGPAGSQEVEATTATLKNAGLAFVTGSATKTTLTTDGTRSGFFFRTVPPDAQQGTDVANFMIKKLKVKSVYIIDDEEAYSTGLADVVEGKLKAAGVSVTRDGVSQQQSDFSAIIAKIPRSTGLVYLPWQLPPKGQAFGQQMQSAGKGSIRLMGSDGLFDPAFSSVGSNVYDSFFPVQTSNKVVKAYRKSHGGSGDYFGAPSYVAAQVIGGAIDRACKNGTASRAEVRAQVRATNLKKSLLGIPISFDRNGDIKRKKFGIWKSVNGQFVSVG